MRAGFFHSKMGIAGLAIVVTFFLCALAAPYLTPYDPTDFDTAAVKATALKPPSFSHPMGTDAYGRDLLTRVFWGARVSLYVGLAATAMMLLIGVALGSVAAYYGGFLDSLIMRLSDVLFAFPYVLGAILFITIMGRGLGSAVVAIGVLGWPMVARLTRGCVLAVRENAYVEAARASGATDARILIKHILPNSMAPVLVYAMMAVGGAIIAESALSFLGLGVQPPTPAWGYMLAESASYLLMDGGSPWWLMVFPGLAIALTVLGFMLIGDGLRDVLDPRTNNV
ncbi:MAG: ABC transporter permease [Candidatus Aquicultorales bacterium]